MEQNDFGDIASEGAPELTPEVELSQEEIDAQNSQYKRIAKRILNIIIKAFHPWCPL